MGRSAADEAAFEAARAHQEAGRLKEAEQIYRKLLAETPEDPDSLYQLGRTLGMEGLPEPAATCFRLTIRLKPDFAEAHFNLGRTLYHLGRAAEAEDCYREALRLRPKLLAARIDLALTKLPILYRDKPQIARARAAYRRSLTRLSASRSAASTDPLDVPGGTITPFYLAYQGRDDRELQTLYGQLLGRAMASAYPAFTVPPAVAPPGPGETIRVGVLSNYFHYHSNWKVPIRGWLKGLDRDRFRIHGYHIGRTRDEATEEAASLCHRFVTGPKPLADWAETIRADRLHVLLIPGIGMDPVTGRLAALRLAPVQATGYGHPVTTGLATIDHFLSSALMEPPGAEAHYTETLVQLPGLGLWYEPSAKPAAPITREEFGLSAGDVVYWCCQGLYKYLPQHDWIFARIALAVPAARFVFIGYPHGEAVTETFRARLAAVFAAAGLDFRQHCRILPFMAPGYFTGATKLADVFLDSIGWSGCNSALEALEADLPVVTSWGPLMRGRHAAAILTQLGLPELIAESPEALAELAVYLGLNEPYRRTLAGRISREKHRLYRDQEAIDGLARYLETAAGAIGS
jgi:protein O-GlcNAc transferase